MADQNYKQLLLQCKWDKAKHPVMHVMPIWDELAWEWMLDPEVMPNAQFRDRFFFWSSIDTKATYALYWSHGFFGPDSVLVAGDLEMAVEGAEEDEDEIHISGYCWEQDGTTHLLSNHQEGNESWADTDDWIFGAFFFDDYMPDGSLIPPCPPGFCRSYERDENGNMVPGCRPMPKINLEESLMQIGFTRPARPGSDVEKLEGLLDL